MAKKPKAKKKSDVPYMSGSPRMTDKVRRGLWLIVARSPTVFAAENSCRKGDAMEREEREAILAAAKYADHHWGQPRQMNESDLRLG